MYPVELSRPLLIFGGLFPLEPLPTVLAPLDGRVLAAAALLLDVCCFLRADDEDALRRSELCASVKAFNLA